jgi:hypothetical protein
MLKETPLARNKYLNRKDVRSRGSHTTSPERVSHLRTIQYSREVILTIAVCSTEKLGVAAPPPGSG